MTIPAISWPELWSVYRRSPNHAQQEILRQLNLPDILEFASKKVKKEILDEAPAEVKEKFEHKYFNPYMNLGKDELLTILFGRRR